jgi:hypothetical protein
MAEIAESKVHARKTQSDRLRAQALGKRSPHSTEKYCLNGFGRLENQWSIKKTARRLIYTSIL